MAVLPPLWMRFREHEVLSHSLAKSRNDTHNYSSNTNAATESLSQIVASHTSIVNAVVKSLLLLKTHFFDIKNQFISRDNLSIASHMFGFIF